VRRILFSILTIFVVVGVGVGVTRAYFSVTKTNSGNTFSTGTIDIMADWSSTEQMNLTDMKPGQTGYKNFSVRNTGSNPVNLFKKLTNIEQFLKDGQVGTLAAQIKYYLSVKLYDTNDVLKWQQTIYDQNVTVDGIKDTDVFLGMIPEGWRMDVVQSYHLDEETGNWAQGATMDFDVVLTGEQLKGFLTLLPKTGDPKWQHIYGLAKGDLSYKVKESEFVYGFTASGLTPSVSYSLIHYVDPYPGNGAGSVGLIGSGMTDGAGNLSFGGSKDLNQDLINAKIWLVPSSGYDEINKSLIGWDQANYLFETGLIDYYDSIKL
jgi:hypothetical protein